MASEPPDLMERLKESLQPTPEMLRRRLDAANAEVLALRAERDALREVVDRVRIDCERMAGLWSGSPRGFFARQILALLPAPTEGAG